MSTKLESIKKAFDDAKARMAGEGKAALSEAFRDFFAANPDVKEICWTQYTPYFNDGGPCEFSVNGFYFHGTTLEDADGDAKDDWLYSSTTKETSAVKKFNKLLNELPEDLFLSVFDNHVKVRATAEGFEVEEYDHD